jgi:hypothetical protein
MVTRLFVVPSSSQYDSNILLGEHARLLEDSTSIRLAFDSLGKTVEIRLSSTKRPCKNLSIRAMFVILPTVYRQLARRSHKPQSFFSETLLATSTW